MKFAVAVLALIGAVAADRHVLYTRSTGHVHWTKGARANSNAKVNFAVAVKQQNLDALDAKFWAVSTPGNADYQNFLSAQQVADLVKASDADMLATKEWLTTQEGVSCEAHADAFTCSATVGAVESLFDTEMFVFAHTETEREIVRHWGAMSVPSHLQGVVEMVTGFSNFPEPKMGRAQPVAVVNDADYYVVPETIVNFYNLQGISGSAKSIQSVAEFQGYPPYFESDLQTFQQNVGITFDVSKKIGPFQPGQPAAESTLDIQYIGAVGKGNTNWYWTSPDWMYEFSLNVQKQSSVPYVISMSYGWDEAQQCQISPNVCSQQGFDSETFVKRVNTEFQKIGAMGVSLLASAGDAGAHGRTDELCGSGKTNPTFPAASPYLTAVGATQIANGTSNGASEPVCQSQLQCATGGSEEVASHGTGALITSGGGFSNFANTPDYQKAEVAAYIAKSGAVPPSSDFNAQGRGYPDVAALGHKYYIELSGQEAAVDGTSASSPVFAGVVGLLNGYLLENGQKQLGFLNPFLYKMARDQPSTFNDITVGNNKCTEYTCCQTGFEAVEGWDAASGLGTPNGKEMLSYVQSQFNIQAAPSAASSLRGAK